MDIEYSILLSNYIKNPEVDLNNFNLGVWYHNKGHTAAAVSFYIRAAERSQDKTLQYESLIRASMCFYSQGSRGQSVVGMLQLAISILPKRPEAYFLLSRYYEYDKKYYDAYMIASIGLEVADENSKPLRTKVDYPGWYGILFEKAVSAWWTGLADESLKLFKDLLYNYSLDDWHHDKTIFNIKNLGGWWGPDTFSSNMKTVDDELKAADMNLNLFKRDVGNKLKVKFNNSDKIKRNYSEAFQDLFVLLATNGKMNGTFVEVGTGYSVYGNNTYLLETEFGWNGVSFDINEESIQMYNINRKSKGYLKDATCVDYGKIFKEANFSNNIDYLQLDCEPPDVTYNALKQIPFDDYKFAVITYEHDYYTDESKLYRNLSRQFLSNNGYKLIVGNVSPKKGVIFEDWWVHPDLVDLELLSRIINTDSEEIIADSLFIEKISVPSWKHSHNPTLEITTTIPKNGCIIDCVFCPQRVLVQSYNGNKSLTFEQFKTVIDKLPKEIRITFAGFTEPWLHKECTDMLLYAYERGHDVAAFTTGIGMSIEDVIRLKDVKFSSGPNGGFVLHLPDNDLLAKHPITDKYLSVLNEFAKHSNSIHNFNVMSMGELHDDVKGIFKQPMKSEMWSRAGNLYREAILKPELMNLKDSFRSVYHGSGDYSCNCHERLYHNVLLPNGDVSLCCMDYGLENIIGNLFEQSYEDVIPKPMTCFDICRYCENGKEPQLIETIDIL